VAFPTTCPICGLESITHDKIQCPQCDADLTCFKVLDSLPDESVSEKTGSGKKVILFVAIGLFLCLAGVLSVFQFKRLETRLQEQQTYFTNAIRKMEAKLVHLAQYQSSSSDVGSARIEAKHITREDIEGSFVPENSLEKPTTGNIFVPEKSHPQVSLPEKINFWIYEANEKDTLWGISKRYYGSGDYYAVLLEHNSHLGIYSIGDGVRLRILENADLAKDIYKKITEKEGNRIYWEYTIAEGDTLQSVAMKFYKSKDMVKRITNLNPDLEFQPGERIKILLE